MYSMNDYKAALAEREEKDFGSQSWNYAQAKVQAIAAILVLLEYFATEKYGSRISAGRRTLRQ